MPLDFPSNPTNGQTYDSYVYNSDVGAWQAREDSATVAVTSPTVPATANNGDIWYNTNTGASYIYYSDGTSSQWVEILSSAVASLDTKASLSGATFTGNVTAPRFISTQTTGTAPLTVSSTTTVANLSADLLDGQHGTVYSPPGMISQFAGISAPTGWLFCRGQEVLISSSTELYNTLTANGTVFPYGANTNGSGSAGSTHFRVPNLQGRIPVGQDTAQTEFDVLGEVGGAKTHTLTVAEMPVHSHANTATVSITGGAHTHNLPMGASGAPNSVNDTPLRSSGGPDGNFRTGFESSGSNYGSSTGTHTHSGTITMSNANSGSGSAHNNLQPYIVINYIIKT
jgi:microcystin-dependent protein